MQMLVALVGDDAMEVAGDGADVAVDRPLIVVQHDDETARLLGDVVQRFIGDAVGEGSVSGNSDDMILLALEVASNGHAKRGGESSTGMARTIGIMFTLGAQHKAVETAGLTDGVHL